VSVDFDGLAWIEHGNTGSVRRLLGGGGGPAVIPVILRRVPVRRTLTVRLTVAAPRLFCHQMIGPAQDHLRRQITAEFPA